MLKYRVNIGFLKVGRLVRMYLMLYKLEVFNNDRFRT